MTRRSTNPLIHALDVVSGRCAPDLALPETWRSYARFLYRVRRRVLESPPCPAPVLRRVQGLFRERREGATATLLRLVYDSWRDLAPALRGGGRPRDLRYEGGDIAVDVRVTREPGGGKRLLCAVDPPRPGLQARIEVPSAKRPRTIDLGPSGAGEVRLPAPASEAAVIVREGTREILRTPRVPLG